jgi:hypothetical protein
MILPSTFSTTSGATASEMTEWWKQEPGEGRSQSVFRIESAVVPAPFLV